MSKFTRTALASLVLAALSSSSQANLLFSFSQVGNDVIMTSSGTLNTNNLVLQNSDSDWGGIGIEYNGNHDIIGNTLPSGAINLSFAFHSGTDFSAWNAGNAWTRSNFDPSYVGTKSFTTYVWGNGIQNPGFGVVRSDLVDGLWSDDQTWTFASTTLSSLGMKVGTYSVSDAVTAETITFAIGQAQNVPEPASIALLGLGIAGLSVVTRRKKIIK